MSVHRAHRVVELPDAGETRGEGDVADAAGCGGEQHAGGVRPTRSGQRQRRRAELRGEQPARGAAACSRGGAASPATPSRSTTPSPISRMAAPTVSARTFHSGDPGRRRAGTGGRRGSRRPARPPRWERTDIRPVRGAGRAGRPAIDARRSHRGDELPVESGVSGLHGAVGGVEVRYHDTDCATRVASRLAGIGHGGRVDRFAREYVDGAEPRRRGGSPARTDARPHLDCAP